MSMMRERMAAIVSPSSRMSSSTSTVRPLTDSRGATRHCISLLPTVWLL